MSRPLAMLVLAASLVSFALVGRSSDAYGQAVNPGATASDADRAAQAAADIAKVAEVTAATKDATVVNVMDAVNARASDYEAVPGGMAGARAARAVATSAGARATIKGAAIGDVVNAAKAAADIFKVPAPPKPDQSADQTPAKTSVSATAVARKTAADQMPVETTTPPTPEMKNLPPASPKVAFETVLPIGTNPAMAAAGDYEYRLYGVSVADRGRPRGAAPASEPSNRPAEGPQTTASSPSAPTSGALGTGEAAALPVPHIAALPAPAREKGRRIGFFAVRYTPSATDNQGRFKAAWYGARAVQTQLVSLADPGQGYSIALKPSEDLVIGVCSFGDDGSDPRFGWLAIERTPEPELPRWTAFLSAAGQPNDVEEPQDLDLLADKGAMLDAQIPLDQALPRPVFGNQPNDAPLAATVRVVLSGDLVTFAIEVRHRLSSAGDDPLVPGPNSFHLVGEYRLLEYFPPPSTSGWSPSEDRLQYGAVVLRNAGRPDAKLVDRAAAFGADVLRRRAESLWDPSRMRTERLNRDRHLVLFVRNARSGETSWLAISGDSSKAPQVSSRIQGRFLAQADGGASPGPELPSPWLAPGPASVVPVESYPMYLGGDPGFRFVEIMIVRKPVTFPSAAAGAPSLLDAGYLLMPPQ